MKSVQIIVPYASPEIVLLPGKVYSVQDSFATALVRDKVGKILTRDEVLKLKKPPAQISAQPDPEDNIFAKGKDDDTDDFLGEEDGDKS